MRPFRGGTRSEAFKGVWRNIPIAPSIVSLGVGAQARQSIFVNTSERMVVIKALRGEVDINTGITEPFPPVITLFVAPSAVFPTVNFVSASDFHDNADFVWLSESGYHRPYPSTTISVFEWAVVPRTKRLMRPNEVLGIVILNNGVNPWAAGANSKGWFEFLEAAKA